MAKTHGARKFIGAERPPRVPIEIEMESGMRLRLPFVAGVMADLSGKWENPVEVPKENQTHRGELANRRFVEVNQDNFDAVLKAAKPTVAFAVPNTITGKDTLVVNLSFESMDDFAPDKVAENLEPLKGLLQVRRTLKYVQNQAQSKAALEKLQELVARPDFMKAFVAASKFDSSAKNGLILGTEPIKQPAPAAAGYTLTDAIKQMADETHERLRRIFRDVKKVDPVEQAVVVLCERLVQHGELVSDNALESLDAIITKLDDQLCQQVNLILHHPDFQALEGTWRGLEHMVRGTIVGPNLKIRVLNITKNEIREVFEQYNGAAFDQRLLFRLIHGPYDAPCGEPFGVLIGGYYFNHRVRDLVVLRGMAQLAAAAHAPFLAGAEPALFGMESWSQLNEPRRLETLMAKPEYSAWESFRHCDDARFVGLILPRFLARLPYGTDNPVCGFNFQEIHEDGNHGNYTWANAAFAMGANITQAFHHYGWCARICGWPSGGQVSGLSSPLFATADGIPVLVGPTEVAVSSRREHELSTLGLVPLCHVVNTSDAVFITAQSVRKPQRYQGKEATEADAGALVAARLPYTLVCCRFIHHLRVLAREAIGHFRDGADMEGWLNRWIRNYVCCDPNVSEEAKAQLPLAAAEVQIRDLPGQGFCGLAVVMLKPHYQLEPAVALRFEFKIMAPWRMILAPATTNDE